jgi:hydrogenase-4 membrane subunit HyfE
VHDDSLVVAGVEVCATGESAAVIGLDYGSGRHIVVPSSVFFTSLAANLSARHLNLHADHIGYSFSSRSNSLFRMFFILRIPFFDFIRNGF